MLRDIQPHSNDVDDETRQVGSVVPPQNDGESDDEYRLYLIDFMDEIDATKRDIKAQIHSRNITARENRTSVDQGWLRRAKDKIDHLTRERDEVRNAIQAVNERIKARRRAAGGQADREFAELFVRAAKDRLEPALYDEIVELALAWAQAEPDAEPAAEAVGDSGHSAASVEA